MTSLMNVSSSKKSFQMFAQIRITIYTPWKMLTCLKLSADKANCLQGRTSRSFSRWKLSSFCLVFGGRSKIHNTRNDHKLPFYHLLRTLSLEPLLTLMLMADKKLIWWKYPKISNTKSVISFHSDCGQFICEKRFKFPSLKMFTSPLLFLSILGNKSLATTSSTSQPRFISQGHTYRAVVGESLLLPCEVENIGKWRPRNVFEDV